MLAVGRRERTTVSEDDGFGCIFCCIFGCKGGFDGAPAIEL